jgi:glutamate synthase (NADPH/NADH)
MLGPRSRSKEPVMLQVFVTMKENHDQWDPIAFERKLYFLRKTATHKISLNKWFYICSLSATSIVYKGQLSPGQVYDYFKDLSDPLFMSHFCIVHSRFSTNTFPSWDRAQPMRFVAHNGEINTLRGNKNWMRAREGVIKSDAFETLAPLFPIIENGGSDSSAFDNVLDLLVVNGIYLAFLYQIISQAL